VVGEIRDRAVTEKDEIKSSSGEAAQRNAVLVFQHGENGRLAVDLALVARLEEFPRDSVEIAANREVVQYRGHIMPLIRVSEVGLNGIETLTEIRKLYPLPSAEID
jgi:two-component system, chemotaxis family, sensor kinase CheA